MLLFEFVKLGQWVHPCSQLVRRVHCSIVSTVGAYSHILASTMSRVHLVTNMTVCMRSRYMYLPKSDSF